MIDGLDFPLECGAVGEPPVSGLLVSRLCRKL
jgi:hypothetical protein